MGKAEITVFGEGAEKVRNCATILYSKWVRKVKGKPKPGDLVEIYDEEGVFLGCGLYETVGPIAVRVMFNKPFYGNRYDAFHKLFDKALKRRKAIKYFDTGFYRLINSDGDHISGLIVDVYNDIVVIQSSSQAIDLALNDIVNVITEILGKHISIYEKSDQKSRSNIGLVFRRRFIRGSKSETIIHEGNSSFIVNIVHGQKTGFFLDQRENRLELEKFIEPNIRVLDLFSYTGGFGIHAANAGAKEVVFVEEDNKAIEVLKRNVELNGVRNFKVHADNVWNALPKLIGKGEKFDVIIADPPAFIPSKEHYRRGVKAYFKLFSYIAKLVKEYTLVFLSSCSYFLHVEDFLRLIDEAFKNQGVNYVFLGSVRGQAKDHVFNVMASYLNYLKSIFLTIA